MNELITVNYSSNRPTVSARELHEFLEVETPYTIWFPRMCEYGFVEGTDFLTFLLKSTGGRPSHDAEITIDMAKELCMLQRNEKGKQARQYFIQLEKDWNSPEKVMARALQIADSKIKNLTNTIEQQAPKVLFADSVASSSSSILVFDLAKLLKQNGVNMGGNRLFAWLREHGYLVKRKGSDYNMPTQKSMNLGLFEIKESTHTHADGHTTVNRTPKVTGKGQVYFVAKFMRKELTRHETD